jgi:hypothetical protein
MARAIVRAMRAFARLLDPRGRERELVPGDVIGRLSSAALSIDDARVSEAHALVSLREGELRLLALRGQFAVAGRPVREATLRPGLTIELAPDVAIDVLAVTLPESVLGVEIEGRALPLPSVCSLFYAPPRVVAGYAANADARVWSVGDAWRVEEQGSSRALSAGETLGPLHVVAVPVADAGQPVTELGIEAPLVLVAHYDTVHVQRNGVPIVTLSGLLARMVSELASLEGPVSWAALARMLWPAEDDPGVVRARLDTNLTRLRSKLREGRVRTDLVRTDGAGQVELFLYAHDRVEDRT